MRRLLLGILLPGLLAVLLPLAPARADDTRTFFWANAWGAYPWGAGRISGNVRMDHLVRLLEHERPAAGSLAELMPSQWQRFNRDMAGRYRLVLGSSHGLTNAVLYDASVYRLVGVQHYRSWYIFGQPVSSPIAILEDQQSGARVAVLAVHNPANLWGRSNRRWRLRCIEAELTQVARLEASGLPVLLGGDFNNVGPVRRHMVRKGLVSPSDRVGIDQLFASSGIALSGYHAITGRRIIRITNHGVVYTAHYQVQTSPSPAA